jgi:hypothetical protein
LHALLVAALFCATAHAQPATGFIADEELTGNMVGIWTNQSVHMGAGGPAQDLWQRIEMRADGELVHDYFAADPDIGDPLPIERLFSLWSVGSYIDPDPAQGTYTVLRTAPYESHSLIAGTLRYRRISSNFIPVFRRFSFLTDPDQITLSEPFVLVLPFTNEARSFPAEASYLDYTRRPDAELPSLVAPASWGQIKKH